MLRPSLSQLQKCTDLIGVEVGVWEGANAVTICEELNIKILYLVDPYVNFPSASGIGEVSLEVVQAALAVAKQQLAKFSDKTVFIQESSLDAYKRFSDKSLDFVYLDGDHRYEIVRRELDLYYPLVRIGGLFAGHDFSHAQNGPQRAVAGFCSKHKIQSIFSAPDNQPDKRGIPSRDWWIWKEEEIL